MDSQPLLPESSAPTKRKYHVGATEWLRIRQRYESTDLTLAQLAKLEGISESGVWQRSAAEHWRKPAQIVAEAGGNLQKAVNDQAVKLVEDKLGPWIEREKVKITKRAVNMATRGIRRLETLWRNQEPVSSRSESDSARTLETYTRTVRTSLGLDNDKGNGSNGLSLEMIAGGESRLRIRQD